MREGYVETANGRIWYSVYGEQRQKTPILVVHGGPGFLSMSAGLETLWEDRPVYMYDQLGCGKSDRAATADFYSVENYVAELAAVRQALKLDEVILMGFSWGCVLPSWPATLKAAFSSVNAEVYNSMWGPSEFTIRGKLKDFDLMQRLPEITQPVLLTCGDRDEAGVKTVKDFQLAFPDACMAVIPKAAHFHHLERPEIFTAVIQEFLRGMA